MLLLRGSVLSPDITENVRHIVSSAWHRRWTCCRFEVISMMVLKCLLGGGTCPTTHSNLSPTIKDSLSLYICRAGSFLICLSNGNPQTRRYQVFRLPSFAFLKSLNYSCYNGSIFTHHFRNAFPNIPYRFLSFIFYTKLSVFSLNIHSVKYWPLEQSL